MFYLFCFSLRMPLFRYFARIRAGGIVYGCSVCYNPICFREDVQVFDDLYLAVSTLRAVNVVRVELDEAFCLCGRYIGQVDGDTFYLHCPTRLTVGVNEAEQNNGVEREWCYAPGSYRFPIWGCGCCSRVIGTDFEFLHHYCFPISLVNVVESDIDRRTIRCICGCYIGYRHRGYVLIGEILQLNSNVTT